MDTNTEYFYAKVKENHATQKITSIYSNDNSLITELEQVQTEFLRFYDDILGQSSNVQQLQHEVIAKGPILTSEQGDELCKEVSEAEIEQALFSIPATKSPGPDGFTSGFYKATWHIVKQDVVCVVQDFFRHGRLLREINATLVTLVPKVECPKTVGDYRPIACCNIIYR